MRKETENRLVELAKNIEKLSKKLKPGFYAEHISNQLMRSSTSAALNYGEAQGARELFGSNILHIIDTISDT